MIVICIASSSIVALLLAGECTAYSTFKIPIDIHETSICSICKQSELADMLRQAKLLIWDELPMQNKHCPEAIDRFLQDIRDSSRLFGGMIFVFGGDFCQILPIITKGLRAQIVTSCFRSSRLWANVQILALKKNMRLISAIEENIHFANWLLEVGDGKNISTQDGTIK